jgi:hypothetical protein
MAVSLLEPPFGVCNAETKPPPGFRSRIHWRWVLPAFRPAPTPPVFSLGLPVCPLPPLVSLSRPPRVPSGASGVPGVFWVFQ